MVVHQTVGIEPEIMEFLVTNEKIQVLVEVFWCQEDSGAMIASGDYVIQCTLKLYSRFASHRIILKRMSRMSSLTPALDTWGERSLSYCCGAAEKEVEEY